MKKQNALSLDGNEKATWEAISKDADGVANYSTYPADKQDETD